MWKGNIDGAASNLIKLLMSLQIEQFIESIYPSQRPPQLGPADQEKTAAKQAASDEAKWDTSEDLY